MIFKVCLLLSLQLSLVRGHGYLYFPPSRSTLYRVIDKLPNDVTKDAIQRIVPNYNDNELNCGGFAVSSIISTYTILFSLYTSTIVI